jgi:hypothetical protein
MILLPREYSSLRDVETRRRLGLDVSLAISMIVAFMGEGISSL